MVFHNFARRLSVSARPITCDILQFFDKWRTLGEAIVHFESYSAESVRASVSQLLEQGLLVEKNSPQGLRDDRISKEWSPWLPEASFHFSTKDPAYVRDHWTLARQRSVLSKTPQPRIFKTVRGQKTELPVCTLPRSEFCQVLISRKTHRQFSKDPLTVEAMSQLLFLTWSAIGYLQVPVFGRLLHKTSPSGGARHPGEVYVMALRVKGLQQGIYYYHPGRHNLTMISNKATPFQACRYCAHQHYVKEAAALFIMTAVFPRTMWKYQHPRAYRVVLLDAGHLCQTFCLVATWLGLAPFCTAALQDTLIEKDLGIDGISESVLYVAGVGLPPA